MIRRLRWKFVLILMSVVTAILGAMSGFLLVTVSDGLRQDSLSVLQRAVAQEEVILWKPGAYQGGTLFQFGSDMGDVTLPYFTVFVDRGGYITVTANQSFDLSSQSVLEGLVSQSMEREGDSGVLKDYNLRYLRRRTELGWRVAYTDLSQERSTLRNVAGNVAVLVLAAWGILLAVSVLLSSWAVRPVERSWKQQRQFVADASHELKTPLTVVRSNAEMLQTYPDAGEEKRSRWLENIQASSHQMQQLVEELLLLARSDQQALAQRPHHQPVELSALLEDCVLLFEPVLFEGERRLESEIQPGLWVRGDAGSLKRLAEIYLDNARKYSPSGSTVTLRLRAEGSRRVCLSVRSEGEPIPPQQLERIFERFTRADQSRSTEGFGLGLAIAKQIAREHRGKVWAKSDEAGENTFFFQLPRIAAAERGNRGKTTN